MIVVPSFSLIQITQTIQDPVRTTSAERALLMLMHDSYVACPYLKVRGARSTMMHLIHHRFRSNTLIGFPK